VLRNSSRNAGRSATRLLARSTSCGSAGGKGGLPSCFGRLNEAVSSAASADRSACPDKRASFSSKRSKAKLARVESRLGPANASSSVALKKCARTASRICPAVYCSGLARTPRMAEFESRSPSALARVLATSREAGSSLPAKSQTVEFALVTGMQPFRSRCTQASESRAYWQAAAVGVADMSIADRGDLRAHTSGPVARRCPQRRNLRQTRAPA